MPTKTCLSALLCVFTLVISSPNVLAIATYQASGTATAIQSNLILPPSVVTDGTVFSLTYSVDETQGPNTSSAARWDVPTFNGFVGDQIAFSGSDGIIDLVSAGGEGALQWTWGSSGGSVGLGGIAAGLVSVDLLSFEVPVSIEAVETLRDNRVFPIEGAVSTPTTTLSNSWTFEATGADNTFISIQGKVDSLVLIDGPATDNPMPGGGNGGTPPTTGNGNGGTPPTTDNGNGAVPEPNGAVIWLTLGVLVVGYRRRGLMLNQ